MRAAVLHGIGDLRVEDIPTPAVPDGFVLIRVAYNGICGSDLGVIHSFGVSAVAHPLTGAHGPQVLGHEFSGVVVETGAGVDGIVVGNRVVVQPNYHCGRCARCRDGLEHLCEIVAFHGLTADGGGLSEFTAVPAANVHVLPDEVSLEQAALVEPLAVTHHAVTLAQPRPGQFALVIGGGPIGIGTALNLRSSGVERILVSEASATRRAIVEGLGLAVVDPLSVDVRTAVHERTDGLGADMVFECAGVAVAVETALASVRARGSVVLLATYKEQVPLNTYALMFSEARVMSSLAYSRDEVATVIERMAAGAYPLDGWVERVPLADVLEGVADAAAGRRMKVLVEVGGDE
ncbi:alcohol dehydrogenase catalytic domain-containing protein [Rhodococcus kronopolitis]|uniref:Alcohol dehydrogenase catalytic domain-containing protein n=1 Tax=Rhodococcus kronopolitis TaxID=1460226 RepID=A0ABV9FTS0_9NOCA